MAQFLSNLSRVFTKPVPQESLDDLKLFAEEILKKMNIAIKNTVDNIKKADTEAKLQKTIDNFQRERAPLMEYMRQTENNLYKILTFSPKMPEEVSYDELKTMFEEPYINSMIVSLFQGNVILMGRVDAYFKHISQIIADCDKIFDITKKMKCEQDLHKQLEKDLDDDFQVTDAMKVNFLFELLYCPEKGGKHDISYTKISESEVKTVLRQFPVLGKGACNPPASQPKYIGSKRKSMGTKSFKSRKSSMTRDNSNDSDKSAKTAGGKSRRKRTSVKNKKRKTHKVLRY